MVNIYPSSKETKAVFVAIAADKMNPEPIELSEQEKVYEGLLEWFKELPEPTNDDQTESREERILQGTELLKEYCEKYKLSTTDVWEDIKEKPNKELRERQKEIRMQINGSIMLNQKRQEEKLEEMYEHMYDHQDNFMIISRNKDDLETSRKVNIQYTAEFIIRSYNIKTIFHKKKEDIYIHRDGYYQLSGKGFISNIIEKILGEYAKNNTVREIIEKIKRRTEFPFSKLKVEEPYLICLKNGVLNLKTNELEPHDPKYCFTTNFDITFDEIAKCPKFIKFLEETLYPEHMDLIQEWFGFQFYGQYFKKIAVILHGPPDTSKTTLLNVMTKVIGEKNISGLSLQKIADARPMAIFFLYNKCSNIYDDLAATCLNDEGGFKMACGGGYLTAEEKFGDQFQFKTYAKQTYAGNEIPLAHVTNEEAYYGRIIPIPFHNIIKKEDQDDFIIDKLTTPEELSGILNWALEGLSRLLKTKNFSYDKSWEEVKEIMQKSSVPLSAFVQDCMQYTPNERIKKFDLYEMYCYYCKKNKLDIIGREMFGRQLKIYADYVKPQVYNDDRIWENVSIKAFFLEDYKKQSQKTIPNTSNTSKYIMRNFKDIENSSSNNSKGKYIDIYNSKALEVLDNDKSDTKEEVMNESKIEVVKPNDFIFNEAEVAAVRDFRIKNDLIDYKEVNKDDTN